MKIVVVDHNGMVIDTYYDVEADDVKSIVQWMGIKKWLKNTLRKGERHENPVAVDTGRAERVRNSPSTD